MTTPVNAIQCPTCLDIIYSRARHDMRWCSCKEVAIDGGFDYQKVTFAKTPPKNVTIEVDATRLELYDDRNKQINKFGLIRVKQDRKKKSIIKKKSSRSSAR